MTPVRHEPVALRSRVKHSSTEPLRSLKFGLNCNVNIVIVFDLVYIWAIDPFFFLRYAHANQILNYIVEVFIIFLCRLVLVFDDRRIITRAFSAHSAPIPNQK